MITPSFSLTATERVLPRLALDFTLGTLDPRVTFTRSLNTATRTNSSGLIEIVNADLPRFDYDPVTLLPKGLLIEEQRSNLQTYSEEATSQNGVRATLSDNQGISPSGANTAGRVTETITTGDHRIDFIAISVTSGVSYTFSVYLKAAGRSWARVLLSSTAFGNVSVNFNLALGQIGTATGATSSTVTSVGNDWYRCSVTATATATVSATNSVQLATANNTISYTGDGISGVLIWGAQLEAGAFATSYIPTTSATVTRNADVATMTGTNFSDWFNASEGTFVAEAIVGQAVATSGLVCASDGTASNRIQVRKSATQGAFVVVDGGSVQTSLANGTWTSTTEPKKCAAAYKQNLFGVATDAAAVTIGFGTVPTVNQLEIGFGVGSNYANGWMQKIQYYPQRLINSELQTFSK